MADLVGRCWYPTSGGHIDAVVKSAAAGCFTVNVSYGRVRSLTNGLPSKLHGYYDLILCSGNAELCTQRYILEETTGHEHYFEMANALGGVDTLICVGENTLQPELEHNIGRFGRQYKPLDDSDNTRKWSQRTGMVPYRWRDWIYELLSMPHVARKYDPNTATGFDIVVCESDISMGDNGQLAEATFSYMPADTDNVISDGERADDRTLHQSVANQAENIEIDIELSDTPNTPNTPN